ncbi:MAG: efflux transporter outer membrane subunit, partial [Steroidobacter sp.]
MRKLNSAIASVLSGLLLAGCAVGPNYVAPKLSVADKFSEAQFSEAHTDTAVYSQTVYSQDKTAEKFWTLFNDAQLNQLVNDALAQNNNVHAALARVKQARAINRESSLDLLPVITAQGGYTESLSSKAQLPVGTPRESKGYDAALDASWELDLFGQKRRALEAARAGYQATEASLHDVQLIVIAEVTRTYFELRGQQLQLDVTQRNVDIQRETLRITRARFDAGSGSELDLSRAQALFATSNANVAPLQAAIARSIHRLSVLTGQQPNALNVTLNPQAELPALPELVAVGDPVSMLRRRPDVRIAERTLAADTARVG